MTALSKVPSPVNLHPAWKSNRTRPLLELGEGHILRSGCTRVKGAKALHSYIVLKFEYDISSATLRLPNADI
jgi:hypothetical protein